jgi:LPS export ABC transporter protein LptC
MITRKTRNGIAGLLLLTAVSFWLSQMQDKDELAPVSGIDPKLNYVLRDFELQFYDENGRPTMNLKAPVLRNDPELEIGTIELPVMKLNQEDTVWDLSSDTATVTADKEYVELIGEVRVRRQESVTGTWVTLETSEVSIEVTPQIARSNESVRMFDGYNRMDAIGLELDLKSDTFSLKQQVKAIYAVN